MRKPSLLVLGCLVVAGSLSIPGSTCAQEAPEPGPGESAASAEDVEELKEEFQRHAQEIRSLWEAEDYGAALPRMERMKEIAPRIGRADLIPLVDGNLACAHARLGHSERALDHLEAAEEAGLDDYAWVRDDEDLRSLHGEPRFQRLLSRLREEHWAKPLSFATDDVEPLPHRFDPPDLPELVKLRRDYQLDAVVAGARTDYERLEALTDWTSRQWEHSSNQTASRADPLTILREAREGGRFICRDYAVVLAGTAAAFGMPARVVGLLPREVETESFSHSVAEVWVEDFRKWVMADGQFGTIAEIDGVPLSALEAQRAIAEEDPALRCRGRAERCTDWQTFLIPQLHYFKVKQDQRRFVLEPGPQLVLCPVGSPPPRKFNGGNEEIFAGAVYTTDPELLYAPPEEAEGRGGEQRGGQQRGAGQPDLPR